MDTAMRRTRLAVIASLVIVWGQAAGSPAAENAPVAWSEDDRQFWSFVPPRSSPPPATRNSTGPRNVVGRHVRAKLEASDLRPSEEAPRAALIRRRSYDLTGLPPTLADVD